MKKLGQDKAEEIAWSAPRLLCVAGGFTRYDEHAVQQMNRNIELIRYRRFGEGLLLLELVNAAVAENTKETVPDIGKTSANSKTVSEILDELTGSLLDIYRELEAFLLALGDDVQAKKLKYYVAFKRLKNFVCLEIHSGKGCLTAYVKVDPSTIILEDGFTRDVREVGHLGTGELEITIRSREDLEHAKNLFQRSYDVS